MTNHRRYPFWPTLFLGLVLCFIVGCNTGYQQIDGRWHYVTWNEGQGTVRQLLMANHQQFSPLGRSDYGKDQKKVFYKGKHLVEANASTFRTLEDSRYGLDDKHVFLLGVPIPSADAGTFRVIEPPYARDNARIFCGNVAMNVADIERFRVVSPTSGFRSSELMLEMDYGIRPDELIESELEVIYGDGQAFDGVKHYRGPVAVD